MTNKNTTCTNPQIGRYQARHTTLTNELIRLNEEFLTVSNELATQKNRLRAIDPAIVSEPRTNSTSRIVQIAAFIFYGLKNFFYEVFSNLNEKKRDYNLKITRLKNLQASAYAKMKEIEAIVKLVNQEIQQPTDTAKNSTSTSSSPAANTSSRTWAQFTKDMWNFFTQQITPNLATTEDKIPTTATPSTDASKSISNVASPDATAPVALSAHERFKATIKPLLALMGATETLASTIVNQFLPPIVSFEKIPSDESSDPLTFQLTFASKHKISLKYGWIYLACNTETSFKISIDQTQRLILIEPNKIHVELPIYGNVSLTGLGIFGDTETSSVRFVVKAGNKDFSKELTEQAFIAALKGQKFEAC